jgi:hypothetical protein
MRLEEVPGSLAAMGKLFDQGRASLGLAGDAASIGNRWKRSNRRKRRGIVKKQGDTLGLDVKLGSCVQLFKAGGAVPTDVQSWWGSR